MRQQRLVAEQMYEAARQEGPVMPRMPIFTGPTAPDMTNVWLQQQQDIMKQQQTTEDISLPGFWLEPHCLGGLGGRRRAPIR